MEGKVTDVYVYANRIDLSNVTLSDFVDGEATINLAGKHFSSINDGLVYGKLHLKLDAYGYATIENNDYDFDYEEYGSFMRNFETSIAGMLHGECNVKLYGAFNSIGFDGFSKPNSGYTIHFIGKVKIKE